MTHLAALLLALVMWDRVLTDCNANTETVGHYFYQATIRVLVPAWCVDEFGQLFECSATIALDPIRFGPDIPDPGSGNTVTTDIDPVGHPEMLPDVPVGGLAAWPWFSFDNQEPVVAVDAAGNESTDPCP